MRVSSLGVARPMYYDRNSTATTGGYYNTVGPHAQTTRWTITNTSSQKMYVDAGAISLHRETAPSTSASVFIALQQPINSSVIFGFFNSATVGATLNVTMGGSILVLPGGSVVGVSSDSCTGGTITYALFCHAIQFDA